MAAAQQHTKGQNSSLGPNGRSDEQRLIEDVFRPDIEKLHLFTQMLRINSLFKKAKVIHK
ncbi:MAG: hypothetical protein JST42_02580 [Bacteroidetes bacterium]|nr:hypothetical protein [Bacteroidota bacterium]